MIGESTNTTIEEAAEMGALLLNGGVGRISDDGDPKRPWLFLAQRLRERTPKTPTRRSGAGG
jgi:hypothetical protein